MFNKIWDFLDGKKSFIGAGVVFIAGGLKALGKIDENTFEAAVAVGGAIAAIGVRFAIKKMIKK